MFFYVFHIMILMIPIMAVGIGIYAGKNLKKRWFYLLAEMIALFMLFVGIFAWGSPWKGVMQMITGVFKQEWMRNYLIALFCISVLSVFVVVSMQRKGKLRLRLLASSVLIVAVLFLWGVGFNTKHCPVYYKYPDDMIRGMRWGAIQKYFGPFDRYHDSSVGWGAYYVYTDEGGNPWYYTIYFEDGMAVDICMEVNAGSLQ